MPPRAFPNDTVEFLPSPEGAPFPATALLERLWQDAEPSWGIFLPPRLRPVQDPAPPPVSPAPVLLGNLMGGAAVCSSSSGTWAGGASHGADHCGGKGGGGVVGSAPRSGEPPQQLDAPGQTGAPNVAGRVWPLSRTAEGCREVQRAFEVCGDENARQALASELRGHVREGLRCPHANHVLQKCIVCMRPQSSQFIIDELMRGAIYQAVRHKYGCRIVQRLLERCPSDQVHDVAEAILSEVCLISRHPYGNYVMQHLLEYGTDDHRHRILRALTTDTRRLGVDSYGCAVISSALNRGSHEDTTELARRILEEPGLLIFMSCTRHGHPAAIRAVRLLVGSEREEALRLLEADNRALYDSRYGRVVAAACLGPASDLAAWRPQQAP